MDTTRSAFSDLAGDGPAVVRVAATLEADVSPLTAYDALTEGTTASCWRAPRRPLRATRTARSARRAPPRTATPATPSSATTLPPSWPSDRTGPTSSASVTSARPTCSEPARVTCSTDCGACCPTSSAAASPTGTASYSTAASSASSRTTRCTTSGWRRWASSARETPLPDAEFVLSTRTLVFDRATGDVSLVFTPVVGDEDDPDAAYDDLRAEAERVQAVLAGAEAPSSAAFASPTSAPARATNTRTPSRRRRRRCSTARCTRRSSRARVNSTATSTPGPLRPRSATSTLAVHVPALPRRPHRCRRESRDAGRGPRRHRGEQPNRGHLSPWRQPRRGPPPCGRDARRREGARRTRDARGPGAQRRAPRQRTRERPRPRVHARAEVQPRPAHRVHRHRDARRGRGRLRRDPRVVPRGHPFGGAEGPRDGAH